nr:hypothetical protein Iba_chr08aCG1450 [Ipomoea batatas]
MFPTRLPASAARCQNLSLNVPQLRTKEFLCSLFPFMITESEGCVKILLKIFPLRISVWAMLITITSIR